MKTQNGEIIFSLRPDLYMKETPGLVVKAITLRPATGASAAGIHPADAIVALRRLVCWLL